MRTRSMWFKRMLRSLHRWLGVGLCLLLMHWALTGWLLNHSESWRWAQRFVQAPVLLNLYGLAAPQPDLVVQLANQQILSQWNQRIFIDQRQLLSSFQGQLMAAVRVEAASSATYVLATRDTLQAVTTEGEPLWSLDSLDGLPQPLIGLDVADGQILLRTPQQTWALHLANLSWQLLTDHAPPTQVSAPEAAHLSDPVRTGIIRQIGRQQISWQQLLLDLHSGRLLRASLLVDAAAFLLIVLSISGLLLFFRRRP